MVGTPWQGRGFASEAARELVGLLGRRSSVRTIVAHIHPDHRASAAVAAAAGLSPTEEEQEGEVSWRLSLPKPRAPGYTPLTAREAPSNSRAPTNRSPGSSRVVRATTAN